jgi:hypothetical protein
MESAAIKNPGPTKPVNHVRYMVLDTAHCPGDDHHPALALVPLFMRLMSRSARLIDDGA